MVGTEIFRPLLVARVSFAHALSLEMRGFQLPVLHDATGGIRLSLEFEGTKRSLSSGESIVVSAKKWNAAGFPLDGSIITDSMGLYRVDLFAALSDGVTEPQFIRVPIDVRHWRGPGRCV